MHAFFLINHAHYAKRPHHTTPQGGGGGEPGSSGPYPQGGAEQPPITYTYN